MKSLLTLFFLMLFGSYLSAGPGREIRQEKIRFDAGTSRVSISGEIKGDQIVDYQLTGHAGQSMAVILKAGNLAAYFNILLPGSEEAIFIGSTSGDRFEGALPDDGGYTIRVYLKRSAARRNETSSYTLQVTLADSTVRRSFDQEFELQGIQFQVICSNTEETNILHIIPFGLEIQDSPVARTIDGVIMGAEVADLNADSSPEIYVYVVSRKENVSGSLVAFSANRRKSLSEIYLPPFHHDPALATGYQGSDEFAVVEDVLVRRFPLYKEGRRRGGHRQLQYKLVPGEAGWLLTLDRVVDY